MNLVNDIFGTNLNDGVQLAIIFAVLLIVLLLVVWLIRVVFGNNVSRIAKNRQPRLAVTDAAIVDDKRRLVLVRRDNVEHLILIGGNSDVLIESNISRVTPVQVPKTENIAKTTIERTTQKTTQINSELKERSVENPPKAFSAVANGANVASKVGKNSTSGLKAIGAGAIAAVTGSAVNTAGAATSVSSNVAAAAKGTVSTIGDASVSVANSAQKSVIETATKTSKAANNVMKDTTSELKSTFRAEKTAEEIADVEGTSVADVPIFDKIKELNLIQKSASQKSAAEIDLEKVLADDATISDTSTGEDDMQKILDELTAEVK